MTDPSRGLIDSNVLPLAASTNLPLMNSCVRATFCAARFVQSAVVSVLAMGFSKGVVVYQGEETVPAVLGSRK
ncbi:unannotated protein [freshwater metagenome]|uniref:Unannotated protein n=1 Tax=freshwater metagenome TaxID=449393 RepID=A0A6J6V6W3_9ZZZZ